MSGIELKKRKCEIMYVYGVSFFESLLSGTSVRPDHVAVFVFFSTVLNDSNCTMNHEIL